MDIHHRGHCPGTDVQNGDHGTEKARPRRSFTPEFKAEFYFSAQYSRIARRHGPNRAAVEVAHFILNVT